MNVGALRAVLVLAVAVVLGSCSSAAEGSVSMEGHAFVPSVVTVPAGTTVTWTNDSDEPHTVTAYQETLPEGGTYFSSGGAGSEEDARAEVAPALIPPGETFEVTFEQPGTYDYFCIPHEGDGMKGTVTVE